MNRNRSSAIFLLILAELILSGCSDLLKPEEVPRLAYIPIAVSKFAHDRDRAERFIGWVLSEEGREIFRKWGYLVALQEARTYGPNAGIGGVYTLSEGW